MLRIKTGWLAAAIALTNLAFPSAARATTLDVLIATGGTVTQGDLVFSNFTANILGGALTAANVDVTPIVASNGASGLRFTGVPAGSFSQSTTGGGGGGAREIVVDVGFTVTVNGSSFRIHGVQQALDPAAAAHNNGIIYDFTAVPPNTGLQASLHGCIAGTGLPSGQTCPTSVDSVVLNSDASSLIVDRQIQMIVGQKFGTTTGDTSTGFFDIAFPEAAVTCPPAPLASNNGPVCEGGTLQLGASFVAGATYQWTGPNAFTSQLQLPTISPVTAAAAGTYSVTVTVGGCTSPAATTAVSVNTKPALPVVSAPASVAAASTFTASVTANAGSTYAWSVLGGTLVSGNGTAQVTVTAGASGSVTLGVIETNAAGCASAQASQLVPIVATAPGAFFFTLTPCRVVDTRTGAGALAAGEARVFAVAGVCGIPAAAKALSVNLAAVPTQGGQLTLYPGDQAVPGTNTLSFRAGIARAVNSAMGMGANGTLGVVNFAAAPTEVIIDVNGYFQ